MPSTSRALPGAERCERPSSAADSTAGDQPGRLAQGPEEKHGLAGRRVGCIVPSLPQKARPARGPGSDGGTYAAARPGSMLRCSKTQRRNAGARRAVLLTNSLRVCELEDSEAEAVRLPRLAYLFLDNQPGRSHRREGSAVGPALRIDDIDKMIDRRLFAAMPFFEEKTSGCAQVFHQFLPSGGGDIPSPFVTRRYK